MSPSFPSRFIILILVLLMVLSCGKLNNESVQQSTDVAVLPVEPVTERGNRILLLDVNERENAAYDEVFSIARQAGAQAIPLAVFWDDIETAPGVFEPDPNWLEIANVYYPANDMKVALTISVIDTNNLRVPSDLQNLSFNDAQMAVRFNALLDYIATQIPDLQLVSLAIGNEIDLYLLSDAEQWAAYESFYQSASQHAHDVFVDIPVGTKTTFDAITGERIGFAQSINQFSDVVLLTYYPLHSDFAVREPQVPHEDFALMAESYPGKSIYLLEVGYPSGEINQSSYAMQQQFVHEVFQAWDENAQQIQLISFTWLNDPKKDDIRWMKKYYGSSNQAFLGYLETLGLHTNQGVPKPAFQQFLVEAAARGW